MNKIPTIFLRDPSDMKHLLRVPHPDCEWVFEGHGTPTRKYDGTCVMLDNNGKWFSRREVKSGKIPPANFVPLNKDPNTGKIIGWEPIEQSSFYKFFQEITDKPTSIGTYELCGPKINNNPEKFDKHTLVYHDTAQMILDLADRTYDSLKEYLLNHDYEGIVFHGSTGRMAKIKKKDFINAN